MTVKKIGKDGKPYNPASFSNIYRLFTSKEVNDKGTWYGWEIERVSEVGEDRVNEYMEARTFAEAIKAGSVQVKHTEDDAAPRVTDTDAF